MPKYVELKQALLADIRRRKLKAGDRLDGFREIMARHQVSKNTVSAALAQLAAEGAIELRHGSGIYVRDASRPGAISIGLILTEADNPFLGRFLQRLSLAQGRLPVNLITKISGFDALREREAARELLDAGASGILLLPEPRLANTRHFSAIHKRGTPVVNVIRRFETGGLPFVVPDHRAAGALAARRLIEQGCRNLAYIGNRRMQRRDERYIGFEESALAAGLTMNRRRVVYREAENSVEAGLRSFAWAVGALKSIDGVMAFHDLYGAGVLRFCQRHSIAIPGGLRVVGCDNLDLAAALTPSLSTVDLGMDQVAEAALRLMVSLVRGERVDELHKVVAPRLVVRESA